MNQKRLISLLNPIKVCGNFTGELGDLRLDSRAVQPGDVFIAVKGSQQDGHHFITSAIGNRAGAILAEHLPEVPTSVLGIEIASTGNSLGRLAQTYYDNPADKLILNAVTGTNGKTTVTSLLYQVFALLNYRPGLLGTNAICYGNKTYASRLTTPDATELARIMSRMVKVETDSVFMEVSSHALEQGRNDGISFKTAVFTNLSHDHLDYHFSMDAYAAAKKKLFDGLSEDSIAIINADDEYAETMVADCKAEIWRLSFTDGSSQILSNTSEGLVIDIDGTVIQSSLIGRFNAYNLGLAYLAACALGVSKNNAAAALSEVKGAEGRMERVSVSNPKVPEVFVDYAHTPDALKNVLETLQEVAKTNQKVHVVFGCGGDRDKTKRPAMAKIAHQFADFVLVTSDNPRTENPEAIIDDIFEGFPSLDKVHRISDREEAISYSIKNADSDTIILIAGKGHETYQEINGVRHDMDDRLIARKALAEFSSNAEEVV